MLQPLDNTGQNSKISLYYVNIGQEVTFYPLFLFKNKEICSVFCCFLLNSYLKILHLLIFRATSWCGGSQMGKWSPGLMCASWDLKFWSTDTGPSLRLLDQHLHLPTPHTPPYPIIASHFSQLFTSPSLHIYHHLPKPTLYLMSLEDCSNLFDRVPSSWSCPSQIWVTKLKFKPFNDFPFLTG